MAARCTLWIAFRTAAALAAASLSCGPAQDESTAENHAVAAATERYVAASGRGDAAALAALYDDSATLLPPEHEIIEGRPAIEAFWRGGLEEGLEVRTTRIETSGTLAYTIGRWRLPATDEEPADSGKLVLCWKREGSTWKLTADIWNTSVPPDESDDADDNSADPSIVT